MQRFSLPWRCHSGLLQAVASSGTRADAYTGVVQAFVKARGRCGRLHPVCPCADAARMTARRMQIYREEGLRSFWKGNGTNVIRVAPYAAAQLSSNDFYKRLLSGALHVPVVKSNLMSLCCARSLAQTSTVTCRSRDV